MNRLVTRNVIVLQFLLSSVTHSACYAAVPQQKKMPITTTSETAREAYKQGMALFHNVRWSEALLHFEKAVAEDSNFVLAVVGVANTQARFKEMFEIMNRARDMLDRVEVSTFWQRMRQLTQTLILRAPTSRNWPRCFPRMRISSSNWEATIGVGGSTKSVSKFT